MGACLCPGCCWNLSHTTKTDDLSRSCGGDKAGKFLALEEEGQAGMVQNQHGVEKCLRAIQYVIRQKCVSIVGEVWLDPPLKLPHTCKGSIS
eukprot:1155099-Pelagomonas_calceolata.AAC.10